MVGMPPSAFACEVRAPDYMHLRAKCERQIILRVPRTQGRGNAGLQLTKLPSTSSHHLKNKLQLLAWRL